MIQYANTKGELSETRRTDVRAKIFALSLVVYGTSLCKKLLLNIYCGYTALYSSFFVRFAQRKYSIERALWYSTNASDVVKFKSK